MSNILDYLQWRGDLTFKNAPVNEVDQLVFAYISYVSMQEFFKDEMTVKQAADEYFKRHTVEEVQKDKSFIHLSPLVLKAAGDTARFGKIKMYHYQNDVSVSIEEQFSAVCLYLPYDNSVQIAYCGTDDTLIGWKEDFNMSFIMPVPSQAAALKYINKISKESENRKIRICGHSKGGNLAVYAAAKCAPEIRDRIVSVYNLDGPGFTQKMIATDGYKAVQSLVTTIVPQSSVIGMLLEHEEEYSVIKSSQTGMLQHDGMSWQVMGNIFEHVDKMDSGAKLFDASLKQWLNDLDNDQRKKFVDTLFDVLLAGHFDTVSELSSNSLSALSASVQAMSNLPEEDRKMFMDVIGNLMTKMGDNFGSSIKRSITSYISKATDDKKTAAKAKLKPATDKKQKDDANAKGTIAAMQSAVASAEAVVKETAASASEKITKLLDSTKKS